MGYKMKKKVYLWNKHHIHVSFIKWIVCSWQAGSVTHVIQSVGLVYLLTAKIDSVITSTINKQKTFPYFHLVVETRVEVCEKKKCCGNMSSRQVLSQLCQVLPNFCKSFCKSIGTGRKCPMSFRKKSDLFFDYQNVYSLCPFHHPIITARQTGQNAPR